MARPGTIAELYPIAASVPDALVALFDAYEDAVAARDIADAAYWKTRTDQSFVLGTPERAKRQDALDEACRCGNDLEACWRAIDDAIQDNRIYPHAGWVWRKRKRDACGLTLCRDRGTCAVGDRQAKARWERPARMLPTHG